MANLFSIAFSLLLVLAVDDASFTGSWERNVEQSDDPEEKMHAAMEQMREQMGGRGGRGGGSRGGGGGGRRGGPPSGSGREGGGGRGGERNGPGDGIGRVSDALEVELSDDELHIDDGERLRIYYLDGDEHQRELPNGTKLETVATRKGLAVVVEEKMDRGEIDRKFELSPDGATMVVTVNLKLGRSKEPVVIRTVYDRAN